MKHDPRMVLSQVVDVFTRGFAASRSLTHPYLVERLGPLWVMRDAERKDPSKDRNREYVALKTPAADVATLIEDAGCRKYVLCVVHASEQRDRDLQAAFCEQGFGYGRHEPIFVYTLPPAHSGPRSAWPIRRVTDPANAKKIAKAARARQIDADDVSRDDADARLFAAFDEDEAVGWVSSIRTAATAAWVANLHVKKNYRKRGLGSALMRAMLHDDAQRGITHSVLTASRAGAGLYRKLGYQQVGAIELFYPPKR